jgi:uncharacterized protein RhaS with RHS repeats
VKDLSGNTITSFTYHPDGLRKTKTVNGVTYHYHYDGSNLIRITDDNGQTVWVFTWVNGKPNTVTNQNGNTFYYVTNYRGDVVRIVNENGATVASCIRLVLPVINLTFFVLEIKTVANI